MSSFWEFFASPKAVAIDALPLLADAALKGVIVFGAAALIVALLRKRSAATKHAVWAGAVAAQLAIPLLGAVLPAWRVPLLPALDRQLSIAVVPGEPVDADGSSVAVDGSSVAATIAATMPVHAARVGRGRAHASAHAAGREVVSGFTHEGFGHGEGFGRGGAAMPALAVENIDGAPGKGAAIVRALAVIWLLGALVILGRFVAGTVAVWRLARRSERVDDGQWLSLAQRIANALGVRRPMTLLRSGRIGIPVTWGVVYPVVLLPSDANEWREERRRYVLVHEMAHVKRVDAFTQLIAQFALAIFWFDPLVWLSVHRMRVEREHACDDYVLRQGTPASTYASDLLEMVRARWNGESAARPAFAALAMARPAELEARMLAILDSHQDRRSLPNAPAWIASLGACALLVPLAAFNPFATRESRAFEPVVTVTVPSFVTVDPRLFVDLKRTLESTSKEMEAARALAGATAAQVSASVMAEMGEVRAAARATRASTAARASTYSTAQCNSVSLREHGSSTSTSIHVDDEPGSQPQFQFVSSTGGRCLQIAILGNIGFTDDEREIRSVSRGGRFYVRERLRNTDRELTVRRAESARLEYDFVVDGERALFDDGARDWLASLIPEILRESGLNAKERVSRIRRVSGVHGVLAEIERMSSAGAKRVAYTALLDGGGLSEEDLDLILRRASRDLASSDGEMRAVLEQVARAGRLPAGASVAVGEAVGRMSSDGEKRSVLQQYAASGDREMLLVSMRQARQMTSDGEKAGFLRTVASRYLGTDDDALRSAYFSVIETITSDGERRAVLTTALGFAHVSPSVVLAVLEGTRQLTSDGEKAELLVFVVQRHLLGPAGVREAFMRATRSITSDSEYRRVMEAALQQ